MRQIILIAHNVRSTHNVGSLLRTAEGLSVQTVYLTGYTPYPLQAHDQRLPHIAQKLNAQIHKTALDAETLVDWQQRDDILRLIAELKAADYHIIAVEQAAESVKLPEFKAPDRLAIIVGREVEGIEAEVLDQVDSIVEIPMFGRKESFNVVQAAAMMLYHCRFS